MVYLFPSCYSSLGDNYDLGVFAFLGVKRNDLKTKWRVVLIAKKPVISIIKTALLWELIVK